MDTNQDHGVADMDVVHRVFQRSADAIVQASQLAKTVAELEAKVNEMMRQLDRYQQTNRVLDEQLQYVRKERDSNYSQLMDEREAHRRTREEHEHLKGEHETVTNVHNNTVAELEEVRSQRDAEQLRAIHAEDNLRIAEAKLEKITKALGLSNTEPVRSVDEDGSKATEVNPTPPVNPSNHIAQPRDPETQQWRSPYEAGEEPERLAAKPADDEWNKPTW